MAAASRLLEWVKARDGYPLPLRWMLRISLLSWKTARRILPIHRITTEVVVDGHRMRVRSFSYDDLLTVSPDYEPCLAGLLPPPGGIAVDAGAFIGRYTLAYARAVGPTGRVVAVEPLPANYRLLTGNVALNRYSNVTCVPYALGRDAGEVRLTYDAETSTASAFRRLSRSVVVPQTPLDDLLDQLGIRSIDLLKIDVEGAELDVLEGSRRVLAASPAAHIIVEIHSPAEAPRCPVRQWLTARGYTVALLVDGKRRFYSAHGGEPGGDLFHESCHRTEGARLPAQSSRIPPSSIR
ncbi:MAG: FkbM family methyltransferase [Pirellulales bacterium]|nr:FkbM family methyltransferase [Pirellulales bacterium]